MRKRVPLELVASLLACCILEIIVVFLYVGAAFDGMEQRELYGKASQFVIFIEREQANLESFAKSYAEWNDSLEYVRNRDPDFPASIYNARWRQSQSIELVVMVDSVGRRIYSNMASVGVANDESGFFGATEFKRSDSRVFSGNFGTMSMDSVKGFMLMGGHPFMYVASPITDDTASAIPEGVLVFGRRLSGELLASFLASPYTSVSFIPASSPELAIIPINAVKNGKNLVFYSVITDAEGKSIGAWKMSMDRDLPKDVHFKLAIISVFIFMINALLCGIIMLILRKTAFLPFRVMKECLDRFSQTGMDPGVLALGDNDELSEVASHINQLIARVGSQSAELDKLAGTDGLTGLANRKRMEEYLDVETRRICRKRYENFTGESEARQGKLAFMVIDLDFFKRYNEIYGHGHGDASLKKVADAISACVQRPSDLVCRFESSSFAIVLPDTDEDGAVGLAERISEAIKGLCIPNAGSMIAVSLTASFGLAAASIDEHFENTRIIDLAARALSAAKKAGRNRIVPASLMGKISGEL